MDIVDSLLERQAGYSWQPSEVVIAELRETIIKKPLKTLDKMATDNLRRNTHTDVMWWLLNKRQQINIIGPFYMAYHFGLLM